MYVFPQEDCSIEERHYNLSYASGSQFLVLGALIYLRVAKMVIRCSWGKQITEMSWGEVINTLVN